MRSSIWSRSRSSRSMSARLRKSDSSSRTTAAEAAAFAAFLSEIRASAIERGLRAETVDAILPGIRLHRQAVVADRSQAEFVDTYEAYLRRVSPQRIERGQALMTSTAR